MGPFSQKLRVFAAVIATSASAACTSQNRERGNEPALEPGSAPVPAAPDLNVSVIGDASGRVNEYIKELTRLNGRKRVSYFETAQAAYGEHAAKELDKARRFQEERPQLFFGPSYDDRSVQEKRPISYVKTDAYDGKLDPVSGRIYINSGANVETQGYTIAHEHNHGLIPKAARDQRVKVLKSGDVDAILGDRTIFPSFVAEHADRAEMAAAISENRPPNGNLYTLQSVEIAEQCMELNRAFFHLCSDPEKPRSIQSPEDALIAMRSLGLRVDETLLRELFESKGLPFPTAAMQVEIPQVPEKQLKQAYFTAWHIVEGFSLDSEIIVRTHQLAEMSNSPEERAKYHEKHLNAKKLFFDTLWHFLEYAPGHAALPTRERAREVA
jgi:hypothetical protein